MCFLGIETCRDETAAGFFTDGPVVLANEPGTVVVVSC
jgi:hypothetical protein